MQTDSRIGGGASAHVYRHPLLAGISVFLQCLTTVADPKAKRRVRWTPQAASTAAVLMSLEECSALRARFSRIHSCMKTDFSRRRRTGRTYNGLLKALQRQKEHILPLVKQELRRQAVLRWKRMDPSGPWVLLAVDGSKEELPRTRSHEQIFGIADNGCFPQALLTAIVEVYTGLPWDWRIGEGRGSEKNDFMDMIPDLPAQALLLADGNFVGLPIWEKLCVHKQPFLIRVGGNVRLLTDLWPEAKIQRKQGIVYVWPLKSRGDHPPLQLRLIQVGSSAKPVYLLTNVLDARRLSKKSAGKIYRLRWGVELFYRTLKRTLGCAKLRSRTARRAEIELEWTLVAMAILVLMGIDAAAKRRRDPRRLSPAGLIQAVRNALHAPPRRRGPLDPTLGKTLANCLKDNYQRKAPKASRHKLRTRNTPTTSCKPPIIRQATAQEKSDALTYRKKPAA